MKIQPGTGYNFNSSSKGFTLDTTDPFPNQYKLPTTQFQPRDEGQEGGTGYFSMSPGTLNGIVPCVGGTSVSRLITNIPSPKTPYDWAAAVSGYQTCYIYLQAGPATGSGGLTWPDASIASLNYPTIFGYPYTMENDDDSGYLLLAVALKNVDSGAISFSQFITTSMWSERHKYSQPNSAFYFYYSA
jgi:hypothetical protein